MTLKVKLDKTGKLKSVEGVEGKIGRSFMDGKTITSVGDVKIGHSWTDGKSVTQVGNQRIHYDHNNKISGADSGDVEISIEDVE